MAIGVTKEMSPPILAGILKPWGGLSRLAKKVGCSHQAILKWRQVPCEYLLAVEKATGIPRHELRPDLFKGYSLTRSDKR
jgi:DNA-binding transcriptional regulator YdaS (Cro superfamily)